MTNCWFCGSKMIWQSDFTYEDYCMEGDGTIAVLVCSNDDCKATAEFSKGDDIDE